jgi:hypothetical protein
MSKDGQNQENKKPFFSPYYIQLGTFVMGLIVVLGGFSAFLFARPTKTDVDKKVAKIEQKITLHTQKCTSTTQAVKRKVTQNREHIIRIWSKLTEIKNGQRRIEQKQGTMNQRQRRMENLLEVIKWRVLQALPKSKRSKKKPKHRP